MSRPEKSQLDHTTFIRGLDGDIETLRSFNETDTGAHRLRAELQKLLSGYLAASNFADDNIYFAGIFSRRAGLSDADTWAVSWLHSLDGSAHYNAGMMLISFLNGFYGDAARKHLVHVEARLAAQRPGERDEYEGQFAADVDTLFDAMTDGARLKTA